MSEDVDIVKDQDKEWIDDRSDQVDGNEVLEEGTSPPLDLDSNELSEVDEETLPYAEED